MVVAVSCAYTESSFFNFIIVCYNNIFYVAIHKCHINSVNVNN